MRYAALALQLPLLEQFGGTCRLIEYIPPGISSLVELGRVPEWMGCRKRTQSVWVLILKWRRLTAGLNQRGVGQQ